MAPRQFKDKEEPEPKPRARPATTPEAREQQMVSLAIDVAEKQLRDGTASAQVISHYLKIGSTREHVELTLKREEIELARMRREALLAQQRIEAVYTEALEAMRNYQGNPGPTEEFFEE